MCGLAGVFGSDIEVDHLEAFRNIASLSYLRGHHSTGFADYCEEPNPSRNFKEITTKKTVESSNDFYSPRGTWDSSVYWDKYFSKKGVFLPPSLCMSHSRFATIGTVKKENAHPFVAGNIIGMHNGTIRTPFEGRDKYDTDSEAVFNLINEKGATEALKILSNLSNAAFALTWIDREKKTLNIVRNKERPLYFVRTWVKDICFYASDKAFLSTVLPYFDVNSAPEVVPIDTLFTFDLKSRNIYGSKTQEVAKPEPFFPKERNKENTGATYTRTNGTDGTNVKAFVPVIKYPNFSPFKAKETSIPTYKHNPDNNVTRVIHNTQYQISEHVTVSPDTYNKLLHFGCRACGEVATPVDGIYFMQDKATYICSNCIQDDQLVEFCFLEINQELADKYQHEQNQKLNDDLPDEMLPESNTSVAVH